MRGAIMLGLVVSLLTPGGSSAQDSSCRVELKQLGAKKFRVILCDEDPAAINDAIARAQSTCNDLPTDEQPDCYEAVAASFELRRTAMMRRALREGQAPEAVADRFGASLTEVELLQAELAPPEGQTDPEAAQAAAAELERVERDLADFMAREGLE